MKVLVVGSGGREHALARKIEESTLVEEVLCAPGNGGTAGFCRNLDLQTKDAAGIEKACKEEGIGLVVIGPEEPLCDGLGDRLRREGLAVFGPGAEGARLEGSKLFAKEFLERYRIPTAAYRRFDRAGAAKSYLEAVSSWPQVVKADGIAAGKGVFVCHDAGEACGVVDAVMEERTLGAAGAEVVIEEFMCGRELSIQVMTDGRTICLLQPVMDHKQVGEGDTGPNTGGMGIYSPVAFVSQRLMQQIELQILLPTLHGLVVEGIDFRGVLYAGLMITDAGPRVLEYNCRFGDPETQAICMRMKSDIVPYLLATAEGRLEELDPPEWDPRACVGVVACTRGYPGGYETGLPIRGLERAEAVEDTVVFHGGTRVDGDDVLTSGGRVLCVTSLGSDLDEARRRAYEGYGRIDWSGKFCRNDIGLARPTRPGMAEPASPAYGDFEREPGRSSPLRESVRGQGELP
jgi:phosphoribosylamine--glycine ligase